MATTFLKRQKEMKRQEKQREKAERRKQKKLAQLAENVKRSKAQMLSQTLESGRNPIPKNDHRSARGPAFLEVPTHFPSSRK